MLPVLTLLLLVLTMISRRDIFCFAYAGMAFILSYRGFDILAKKATNILFFRRIRFIVYSILALHVFWTFPASLIEWDDTPRSWLKMVQVFGLRYGQNVQLLASDPRVDVWSRNGGLVWEFLVLVVTEVQLAALDAAGDDWAAKLQSHLNGAADRGKVTAKSCKNELIYTQSMPDRP